MYTYTHILFIYMYLCVCVYQNLTLFHCAAIWSQKAAFLAPLHSALWTAWLISRIDSTTAIMAAAKAMGSEYGFSIVFNSLYSTTCGKVKIKNSFFYWVFLFLVTWKLQNRHASYPCAPASGL